MHNFKDLTVWKKSIKLAIDVYHVTQSFPNDELYGLTAQIRRCVISISSNIAEGSGRSGNKSFKHFLDIAYGSSFELETQLLISRRLNYLNEPDYKTLNSHLIEIQKMLFGLSKSLDT